MQKIAEKTGDHGKTIGKKEKELSKEAYRKKTDEIKTNKIFISMS